MSTSENREDSQGESLEMAAVKKLISIMESQLEYDISEERKQQRIDLILQAKEIYQLD